WNGTTPSPSASISPHGLGSASPLGPASQSGSSSINEPCPSITLQSSLGLLALSASVMLMIPSCAGIDIPSVPHQVAFNEAEFAGYGGPGTATVQGHIWVVGQDDHEFHPGDQTEVTLLPVTSYTTEM